MPKSVGELKQSLKKAGKDSRDARPYQEKDVEEALLELKRLIQEDDR